MKKPKKALLTAAILATAVNLTSCYAVYGPPPEDDESGNDEKNAVMEEEPTELYNDDFAAVYGPPPDMGE